VRETAPVVGLSIVSLGLVRFEPISDSYRDKAIKTPNIISSDSGIRFSGTKKILTISDQDFKENQLYFFINLQFR
jgi:hypothetical protein